MTDEERIAHWVKTASQEEKLTWLKNHVERVGLTRYCVGCKYLEEVYRKLFFTKTS